MVGLAGAEGRTTKYVLCTEYNTTCISHSLHGTRLEDGREGQAISWQRERPETERNRPDKREKRWFTSVSVLAQLPTATTAAAIVTMMASL